MKRTACGVALGTLFLTGCHTITEELPTQPTKTPASGVLTVAIPSIPVAHARPDAHARLRWRRPRRHPTPRPLRLRRRAPAGAATPCPRSVADEHQDPHPGRQQVDARHDAARRPRRRLLPQDRVHRRPALLPRPDGGHARPHRVRDLRGRQREGHGPARSHLVPQRSALHRGVSGCENHEDNQYLLYVYKGGLYKACTRDGVCGEVVADR